MRREWLFAATLATICLPGCAALTNRDGLIDEASLEARTVSIAEANAVIRHLQVMSRLGSGTRAEQEEIVAASLEAYVANPGASTQLTLACVLALPGHPNHDASRARLMLDALLADPAGISPAERVLARVMLAETDFQLETESQLLQQRASSELAREQQAVSERRAQAQAAEIARLREQLATASAKLEAIAELEEGLVKRQSPPSPKP